MKRHRRRKEEKVAVARGIGENFHHQSWSCKSRTPFQYWYILKQMPQQDIIRHHTITKPTFSEHTTAKKMHSNVTASLKRQ